MKLLTLLRDLVAACAIALTAGGAAADITFWQLKNVAFGDGATANGSFVYDDLANTVTSWNVRVSAGSGLLAFTYVPGDSIVIRAGSPLYTNASYIEFRSQPGGNGIDPRVLRIMPFWDFDVIPVPSSVDVVLIPDVSGERIGTAPSRAIVAGRIDRTLLPVPVGLVDVIEFYHAGFDRYFITADTNEIAVLDGGLLTGWARTGQKFKAYAAGSSASGTINPVCRYYGLPSAGLGSHFYSGSPAECYQVNARFSSSWQMESDNVFQIALPNTSTGACAAGTIPVYRVFNNRTDANHRYTTSTTIRAQMEALGWVREGYGPDATILCAVAP
jgi:hypothetical protein